MAELLFYHLARTGLEQVLPTLLERTLARGQHAVVLVPTPERLDALDAHLWSYDPASFLPHGTPADGQGADQPVWLTTTLERPNAAEVLFLIDGAGPDDPGAFAPFARVAFLFDGRDDAAVEHARGRWKRWKAAGEHLAYWQQTETGWEQKG